ncbi:7-carboxy-7-deazaguanine synthase QueE [Candidatus Methylospira mobilis]|uniref:7-carboxy-7-deazaguanine synthase n=1 Tax=Candidatus Methylospira mobilis TaxID=1808979 RepID=A0A5Q0BHK5_9GAMM|nr:7-carboxy-7-deazaguanine synthase QueE [Candidatus Methylospira mobilis]QFY41608.1 7-carboxy-7-deazaguanine synthase QueE [Candidatus Methylospira mobilis]WNV05148.1 7-carboxy-7-deazaguanine synthase QueE [Candidatus Methylospira mobilis]
MEMLRITEIFYSLQGESRSIGFPTVFIRLTGCPLRCSYCDTAYAFAGGTRMSLADIMEQVRSYEPLHVCVTGGEPLAQADCLVLLKLLADEGYEVSLETSGALNVAEVDARVVKILDIKTPGSGEVGGNLYANIEHLLPQDQIKFVITGEEDYQWSKHQLEHYRLSARCEVLFSPALGDTSDVVWLADNILRDRLPVRFQLQLHKILWGNAPGK